MDPVELLRDFLARDIEDALAPPEQRRSDGWERKLAAIATYRTLTSEQAHAGARVMLDAYVECVRKERRSVRGVSLAAIAIEPLEWLAIFQPVAMRELYRAVIEHGIFWYAPIYCAGDAATRTALLDRLAFVEVEPGVIEATTEMSSLLEYLAWIGDDAVVLKFAEWRGYTLLWHPTPELVERNPSLAGVSSTIPLISTTREAGWELTLEGQRRDLYSQHWHGLLPAGGGSGSPAPVAVGVPMGMECAWCGRELAAIIDLDLHAPQLAFLQIEGERLRIPACRWCSYGGGNGPLFWRVNTTGEAQWCEANGPRPELGARYDDPTRSYEPAWVAMAYPLGPVRTDPYTSLVPDDDFISNRLGGLPEWVQYPEYPVCPECGKSMRFIGQIDADEHGGWEGLIYACICDTCRLAATVHQQT